MTDKDMCVNIVYTRLLKINVPVAKTLMSANDS